MSFEFSHLEGEWRSSIVRGVCSVLGLVGALLVVGCAHRAPEERGANRAPSVVPREDKSSPEHADSAPRQPEPHKKSPCKLLHCSDQLAVVLVAPLEESRLTFESCREGVCSNVEVTVPRHSYRGPPSGQLGARVLLVEEPCARFSRQEDPCRQGNLPEVLRASSGARHVVVYVDVALPKEKQVLQVRARFLVAGQKVTEQLGGISFDEQTVRSEGHCFSPNGVSCEPTCCVWAVKPE